MELFYSKDIEGNICRLDRDESGHCIKVLRHRSGDQIQVIDGEGSLYHCILTDDNPKAAQAQVTSIESEWGSHPYHLTMAVCPTKNIDRYEWFAEKACEVGLDEIVPVIGEHSERKVIKAERLEKILVSASKQSLKAAVPSITPLCSVKDFITSMAGPEHADTIKLIAYCFEEDGHERISIKDALKESPKNKRAIAILIGPEGDFSRDEAMLAIESGFIPVHLGDSRLRTETAALTAVEAVYFQYL